MQLATTLLAACAAAYAQTLPPLPAPMGIPAPGAVTDAPYAPQPILPGGVVVALYPPGSPLLKQDRVREAEVYHMSQAAPGRIASIVDIHNPSIEFHPADRSLYEEFDKKPGDGPAVSARPDFVGTLYPGPTPFARNRTAPAVPRYAPPAFLATPGSGDRIHAIWAMDYFSAMLALGAPNIEMHVYGNGRHPGDPLRDGTRMTGGLTDRKGIPLGAWQHRFVEWFRDLGFLGKPGVETKAASGVTYYLSQPLPRPLGQR
jgi:hypothetical protein